MVRAEKCAGKIGNQNPVPALKIKIGYLGRHDISNSVDPKIS
jgi:hypothetical protein